MGIGQELGKNKAVDFIFEKYSNEQVKDLILKEYDKNNLSRNKEKFLNIINRISIDERPKLNKKDERENKRKLRQKRIQRNKEKQKKREEKKERRIKYIKIVNGEYNLDDTSLRRLVSKINKDEIINEEELKKEITQEKKKTELRRKSEEIIRKSGKRGSSYPNFNTKW